MTFALLLGYTAAKLGKSMPIKDALPVRATMFSSVPVKPDNGWQNQTINECGSSTRTKIIWETDAHVDDVMVAIMLAKSEKYELDTMIISETGDASTSLVGGNNFLRLLSLLGMHDIKVGLSRPEENRVDFPNNLNRDADMLAGVIEDLPYYPKSVNGLRGSGNYGVDAYDLSNRVPKCNKSTCQDVQSTWKMRPTSTKYYKEALDRGVTTVFVTGTLTALNNVLHTDENNTLNLTKGPTDEGRSYLNMIESMNMMLGNYWKQIRDPIVNSALSAEELQAATAYCKANCTYDYEESKWSDDGCQVENTNDGWDGPPGACDGYPAPEGNSQYSKINATRNVLAALRDGIVKTVPWSTTNQVGNCPTQAYFEKMKQQLNKEDGTKESQLVLDMMVNLEHDAAQYAYGGYLTGGYCFYDQLGYYGLVNETAFTWKVEPIYVDDNGTFIPANMEEGPNKKHTATIQIATISTSAARYFRDEFMTHELTKRCIHHQPLSFKELQQFYEHVCASPGVDYAVCDN
eukprot:CAMPEP_0183332264 /NCGR_PEP_ID=MMETSP0164_2-20130417/1487_1 /TAXON_ID=221442 /ORGANISM="Coccolithus pelagicus ssp braarudi, Strain PLY182g" /LENGTH=517 /DNA_ID=CAMNT_0025500953 /DNA_START=24 /DNA_END=1577 /DNA_ORIENTATION=+